MTTNKKKPASVNEHDRFTRSAKKDQADTRHPDVAARVQEHRVTDNKAVSHSQHTPGIQHTRRPDAPQVNIGRIDVIVEAAQQPETKQMPVQPVNDFTSRHYLRRL
jgi:hypothetical protein